MLITELLAYFLKEKEPNISKPTLKNYQRKLAPFVGYLNEKGLQSGHQITAKAVIEYAEEMKQLKEKIADGAINHLWIIGTFLKWIQTNSGTTFDVKTALNLPKQNRLKKVLLSVEEAELLLENAILHPKYQKRDQVIIMLNKVEGLSPKVLSELNILDADAIDQEIRLKKKKSFMKIEPKTAQYLMSYLKVRGKYLPKTDALLVNKQGLKMTAPSIRKIVRLAMKEPLKCE
jgi:site-specific recombinase XerD